MEWKDTLLYPLRQYWHRHGQTAREPAEASCGPDAEAEQTGADMDWRSRFAERERAERAELAEMAARAAQRASEEDEERFRIGRMDRKQRFEYHRMRWEAVNARTIAGLTPEQRDARYDSFRYAEWEQRNADRLGLLGQERRKEMFRSEDMLNRYRAGLPARDDEECDAYREWAELDADYVEDYVREVLNPQRDYENYEGPLGWEDYVGEYRAPHRDDDAVDEAAAPRDSSWQAGPQAWAAGPDGPPPGAVGAATHGGEQDAQADGPHGAVGWMPGSAGAGSGLEDGPMARHPVAGPPAHDGESEETGPLWLIPPGNVGAPDQAQPRRGQSPSGPVPW